MEQVIQKLIGAGANERLACKLFIMWEPEYNDQSMHLCYIICLMFGNRISSRTHLKPRETCFEDFLQYKKYLIEDQIERKRYKKRTLSFFVKKLELQWLDAVLAR